MIRTSLIHCTVFNQWTSRGEKDDQNKFLSRTIPHTDFRDILTLILGNYVIETFFFFFNSCVIAQCLGLDVDDDRGYII